MNKHFLRTTAIGVGGLIIAAGAWTATAAPASPAPAASSTPSATPLSAAVKADLVFNRDEERMVRDLYAAISKQYDNALPFSNIVNSEQRHYDAMGVLLERYGVADPADGKAAGVYSDADLQKMYDTLLAQSRTSLSEAYKVGIAAETADITHVKKAMDDATQADIDRVYANLLKGSEMHLSAFTDTANGVAVHVPGGMRQGAGGVGNAARTGNGNDMGARVGNGTGTGMGRGAGDGTGTGRGPGDGTGVCINS